jgi:KDO2-lipid IV(A) lauroyltransferase
LALVAVVRLLPHRAVGVVGRAVGGFLFLTGRRNRGLAERNVEHVYGEQKSTVEKGKIIRRSFQSVGMAAIELVLATRWSADDFRRNITIDGIEHWHRATEAGNGIVAVTGHFGSWEIRNPALLYRFDVPVSVIGVSSGDSDLDELVRDIRSVHGVQCFRYGDRSFGYLSTLRRGGVVSFIIDRGSAKVRRGPVNFLGTEVPFPVGFAHLARQTGAPVLPTFMIRDEAEITRHRLLFTEPIFSDSDADEKTDILRITQHAASALEAQIRCHPEQWAWMLYPWHRGWGQRRIRRTNAPPT